MNKHKHYQQIRAFADLWKIECRSLLGNYRASMSHPSFSEQVEYRVTGKELPKQPKKRVKMWQWVVRYGSDTPYLTSNFFPTIERARSAVGGVILQSADWTEIEVEES